jgi:hypothetical protein
MLSELNDFIHGLGVNESEAGKYETCKGVNPRSSSDGKMESLGLTSTC